jgi:dTDP-D-glucose 4,6-dehydratase
LRFLRVSPTRVCYGSARYRRSSIYRQQHSPNGPYSASKVGGDLTSPAPYFHTYGVHHNYHQLFTNVTIFYRFPEKLVDSIIIASMLLGKPLPVYGDRSKGIARVETDNRPLLAPRCRYPRE